MGPTRLWVWSCWIEEIREPAKEELQKLQRSNHTSAGVAQIARSLLSPPPIQSDSARTLGQSLDFAQTLLRLFLAKIPAKLGCPVRAKS